MNPHFQLALGMLMLSGCLGYALWASIRVWCFRQDLFEIRDALWDAMRSDHQLDDPAHRQAREQINGLIRFAPRLSFITLLVFFNRGKGPAQPLPAEAPPSVHHAIEQAGLRIARFMMYEQVSGWVVLAFAHMILFQEAVRRQTADWVIHLLHTSDLGGIEPTGATRSS